MKRRPNRPPFLFLYDVPMHITLHRFRWPFAAARTSMWLLILTVLAFGDATRSADRPFSRHATAYPRLSSDIELTLKTTAFFVNGAWVASHDESVEELRWLVDHNRASRVVVRVGYAVSFGDVRKLIASARAAGVRRVTIETQRNPGLVLHLLRLDDTHLNTPPERVLGPDDFSIRSVD
jgi:biopolymer transport protein ExbD